MSAARALSIVLLLAGVAAAAGEPRDEAKRLKDLGAEALDRGDYPLALDLFEKAFAVYPSPNLRYNLGLALGGMGRYPEAIESFEIFLREAKSAPAEARAYAQDRLNAFETRVGRLVLHVAPADAEVSIDRRKLARSDGALRLTPGPHEVQAQRAGLAARTVEVNITAGRTETVELTLRPPPKEPPPLIVTPAVAAAPAPKRSRTWVWITAGAAAVVVAGVAIGLGVGLTANHAPDGSLGPAVLVRFQ